jgi:GlpG protein
MRELGTAADAATATLFIDYLLTQKIPALLRDEAGRAEIWIRNEDDLERARQIWAEFQQNPKDSKFSACRKSAQEMRKLKTQADKKYAALYQDAYDFWGRPSPVRVPLTVVLIAVSIILTLWTNFGKDRQTLAYFTFTDKPNVMVIRESDHFTDEQIAERNHRLLVTQTECLRQGQWWRLITPIFLHFGMIHLVFNMYALFTLGGLVEYRRGPLWMFFFVLVTGILSNALQFLMPTVFEFGDDVRHMLGSSIFGGMSGVDYAIFGYLMAKTLFAPEPGLKVPSDIIYTMLIWLIVCMTGWVGHIANTAHAVGFLAGFVIAIFPKYWRKVWRKP